MDASIRSDILQFLRYRLDLTEEAQIISEPQSVRSDAIFKADFLISDGGRILFVIIKRRLSFGDLARIKFLQDFNINFELNHYLRIDSNKKIEVVALTVYYSRDVEEYFVRNELNVLTVPPELYRVISPEHKVLIPKLSSGPSFKVIYTLLELRSASIAEISRISGVSYGWTHAVISRLIQVGGVNRHSGFISVSNIERILDSIAYERPLKSLVFKEVYVDYDNALDLSREITALAEIMQIHPVFTSYTASSVRDKYNVRHDNAVLYLSKAEFSAIAERIPVNPNGKIRLTALIPDRDVQQKTEVIYGINVASEEQTLLDLISGGISTREIVLRLVEKLVSR